LSEDHPTDIIKLDLPASHRYLNLIGASIAALLEREILSGDRDLAIQQIELAVHETCINIVEHAYMNASGRIVIYLSVEENPKRLIVNIFDTGASFDTAKINLINIDGLQDRGYGLFLIHQLMENVVYLTEAGENHWHLEKFL